MSNHWNTNSLSNSYLDRISQQQYFSRLSADNGIASKNGNTYNYYYVHDGPHGMSAISGHPTAGPLETQLGYAWVSTVHSKKISVRLTYFSVRLITTKPRTTSF
jgi:hypothetical protein